MYVDGDLVQSQSTSIMSNKSITIKYRCKFKQKSAEGSSEEYNQSQSPISALRVYQIRPNNMLSKCDTSIYSSECKLPRIVETVKIKHVNGEQKRHKTRNLHKTVFHKNRQKFKGNVLFRSSTSIWFASIAQCCNKTHLSYVTNLHPFKSSKRKKHQAKEKPLHTYKIFLDSAFDSGHLIFVDTGFEPR